MENIIKQIKAVMLGHAIGDALGVPVEFEERSALENSPVTDMIGYGTYPFPKGTWSDDTSMSVATLDALCSGCVDYTAVMENFVKWYAQNDYTPTGIAFDIGVTCQRAILNYLSTKKPSAVECGLNGEYSNGNGALMRIHPVAMMAWFGKNLRESFENIIDCAAGLTHAHECSKLACRIYTLILFALLENPRKESIISALKSVGQRYSYSQEFYRFSRIFSDDFCKLPSCEIKSSGYVIDTIEAALWCILTSESYEECVLKAVNLGGDTDTVGAVAGGLAGALYGYDAIPKRWLDALIRREYIEKMCERAGKAWRS